MTHKVIALLFVGLLIAPVFADMADAGSYYYTGKAYVSSKYRYVGFTPEKITIKTNIRWDKSVFGKNRNEMGQIMYNTLTIKLYSWSDISKRWYLQDSETYHNKFNNLGRLISKEFSANDYMYYKHWWDRFSGRRYVMFKISIPKDHSFYHHNSGKTKIDITLKAYGSAYNFKTGGFETIHLTVRGNSQYWTKPTNWDAYKRYWGYSASAQEFNGLMEQQPAQTYAEQPITFSNLDIVLTSMFILGVGILAYTYVSDKKKNRGGNNV